MTLNIKVRTDFRSWSPGLVRFQIDESDVNTAWEAAIEIGNWLIENKIEYTVVAFSDEKVSVVIPSEESRVLVRLTYDMVVDVDVDADDGWSSEPNGSWI
jgi:hypothetical protein|tara:strand:+ start:273 stop:572 length:300 start_codon:yes stop_codon:yes gene_type:complete